jgi:hypothetical protein
LGFGHSAWGNDTTEFLVYSGIQTVEEDITIFYGYRVPEAEYIENLSLFGCSDVRWFKALNS